MVTTHHLVSGGNTDDKMTQNQCSYFYFSRQFLQQYLYIVVNITYIVYYSS